MTGGTCKVPARLLIWLQSEDKGRVQHGLFFMLKYQKVLAPSSFSTELFIYLWCCECVVSEKSQLQHCLNNAIIQMQPQVAKMQTEVGGKITV